jgi:hypothetical protein
LFLNSHVRFDEIYDGSSKTLLISSLIVRTPLGWISGTRATLRNTSTIEIRQHRFAQLDQQDSNAAEHVAESLFVVGARSRRVALRLRLELS